MYNMKMKKLFAGTILASVQVMTTMTVFASGWSQVSGKWKYVKEDQSCIKNQWYQDQDNSWYYFDSNGFMESNAMTPDGYVVGDNGIWIQGLGKSQDQAVSPWMYQALLGKGMDVTWAEFRKQANTYHLQMVKDFKQAGVDHVRIRVKDEISDELLTALEQQVSDCLANGIIPVIAYQAHEFKENPNAATMNHVTEWWTQMAEHFKNASHLVSFDLMIESSDAINKQPEVLNQMYENTVHAIRKSNPDRIIMISPRLRSDPNYLHELKIPSDHNGYLMAEWHFYASGPDKTNEKKKWTTGTEAEKKLIQDKINTALAWQKATGIPTWVGAWMPGNYNKGNNYSINEQVGFASYMTSALTSAGIPFAVNADTKFYDAANSTWIPFIQPVFHAIFQ